jgi:two-component system, sensor histidine kinase YesM
MQKIIVLPFVNKRLDDIKISTKITLYYLILLTFSIAVSGFCYYRINSNLMSRKISDVSFQMLGSISANIDTLIDNTNNFSKTILCDANVQGCLKRPDLSLQRNVNRYLINLLDTTPFISAIYLFDNYGNRYGVDELTVKTFMFSIIQDVNWYREVFRRKGGYLLKVNAGDIFKDNLSNQEYVSLIRIVNDLNTQKPLGVLIVNISSKLLSKLLTGVDNQYYSSIMLKDENNQDIVKLNEIKGFNVERILSAPKTGYRSLTEKYNGKWYLVSTLHKMKYGWRIISIMPFDELSRELRIFSLVAFIIIFLNSLLIFLGSVLISRLITTPIEKLLQSMKDVKKGKFEMVQFETGQDEIGKLKDGYNIMIQEIQKLLERTIEEQKIIRKTELEVLQAQIKPHFLYNTFDAISSLALSGRSGDVYTVMKALGSYYRISLSKGNQIITVAEEVEIVKNYLIIQQIRYGDIFTVNYDIDEQTTCCKVLKLILQPLVENALYHGIKPKGERGVITVAVKLQNHSCILAVMDDGVGMTAEKAQDLMKATKEEGSSFGIRGTIERLRIFYGIDDILRIDSDEGKGTIISVHIPLEGAF